MSLPPRRGGQAADSPPQRHPFCWEPGKVLKLPWTKTPPSVSSISNLLPGKPYLVVLFDASKHHVHHLIGIAHELIMAESRYQIVVLYTSREMGALLSASPLLTGALFHNETRRFYLGKRNRFGSLPYKSIAKHNRSLLNGATAIIGASYGLHRLALFGIDGPQLLFTDHGLGFRRGNNQELLAMDLILVAGQQKRNYYEHSGIFPTPLPFRLAQVGYPKLDFLERNILGKVHKPESPFQNDLPTLYYNPHWDGSFTSGNHFSAPLLEWVAETPRYNLIISPHPLFRHFHRRTARLIKRYSAHPRIRVDFGSLASVDFTYFHLADIYMGDMSSSAYEWLAVDKPILFLNAGIDEWQDNPVFDMWKFGPVVTSFSDVPPTLAQLPELETRFRPLRQAAFADAINVNDTPSSRRAAEAILDHLSDTVTP